jgi:hypothetical protein
MLAKKRGATNLVQIRTIPVPASFPGAGAIA